MKIGIIEDEAVKNIEKKLYSKKVVIYGSSCEKNFFCYINVR